MNRKPLINPEIGDADYKYTPREFVQDLFIPIEADDNKKFVGDCSLVGNMQAPSYFSEDAKEEFYKQLKNTYGDKFDEETKQLRMDNMKVNPNTGGIYSVSLRYSIEVGNKGLFKKFLSKLLS